MSRSSTPSDPALIVAGWGAIWGVALGVWLLAPEITETHHLYPTSPREWLVYAVALSVIFAVMGAFLAFVAGFALVVVERVTVGVFRNRAWAYALWSGVLVVAAYGAEACLIHLLTFGSLGDAIVDEVPLFVALVVLLSSVVGTAYQLLLRTQRSRSSGVLALALATVAIIGMLALTATAHATNAPKADRTAPALTKLPSSRAADVPLLFIGLDGATWRVLMPSIEHGHAPVLRALLENGTHGDVEALWPPYWSGAAWGAIVTGLSRDTTGVYEDWAALAPGLPPFQTPLASSFRLNPIFVTRSFLHAAGLIQIVRPPRALLNGTPFWELLHNAGVETAVVRFRFTHPPQENAGVIVSDWVGDDGWGQLGAEHRETEDTVAPRGRATELLAPFRTPSAESLFDRLIGSDKPTRPANNPLLDPVPHLRAAASLDNATFDVAESLLKSNGRQSFLAIYFVGLDSVQHVFWQYRFPDDFDENRPPDEDIRRLGAVIDRYVAYFDERLGVLLDSYAVTPNVVIVSDHGQGGKSVTPDVWLGSHTKDGIFLARGPSIPKQTQALKVSYYDVLPTVVALKGFTPPPAMSGRALFNVGSAGVP